MPTETTQPTPFVPTEALAKKILETVDAGLSRGKGSPRPGYMCVEAAVCYAMGLPHGDRPPCVGSSVRDLKVQLNDSPRWKDDAARAAGMRALAIAQLGSEQIDQYKFCLLMFQGTVRKILPKALGVLLEMHVFEDQHGEIKLLVDACKGKTLETAVEELVAFLQEIPDVGVANYLRVMAGVLSRHLEIIKLGRFPNGNFLVKKDDAVALLTESSFAKVSCTVATLGGSLLFCSGLTTEEPVVFAQLAAEIALEVLKELNSPGCEFLYLLDPPPSQPLTAV